MQVLFLLFLIMSGASASAQVHDVHYQGNLSNPQESSAHLSEPGESV